MAPTAVTVNDMLKNLEEEDYRTAICFIEYLSTSRKKKRAEESKAALLEIQKLFADDKGWDSEESMLEEGLEKPLVFSPAMMLEYIILNQS